MEEQNPDNRENNEDLSQFEENKFKSDASEFKGTETGLITN